MEMTETKCCEKMEKAEAIGMLSGAPVHQEGKKLWQYLATFSACALSVSVGTALAWTSPILPKLKESKGLDLDTSEKAWVGALLAIGSMIGAAPAGSLSDKIGRKKSLLLLSVPFLISWALILVPVNVWILYIARFVVGLGVGAACVLVPTYISDIAEASVRGTLGALFQLFLTVGIVLGFSVGAINNYTALAITCVVVVFIFLATFVWMPESPAWLVNQKKKTDAISALTRLRGDEYDVLFEYAELLKVAEENASRESSIGDLFKTTVLRRALIISFSGMIFQQLSGINAVVFYTGNIFHDAGSSLAPDLAAIIVALVQCIMAVVAALIVDRAGRRPLLLFSSAVMGLSLIALGLYFKLKECFVDISSLGWLPLSSLTLFMIAFSVGIGPIPWMITGELFPAESKGNASSLAVVLNWFLVFLVTKAFPEMNQSLGSAITFWTFAGVMFIATFFIYFVVPETKGKTIQTIQAELEGR